MKVSRKKYQNNEVNNYISDLKLENLFLYDQTTKIHILWATDDYKDCGTGFLANDSFIKLIRWP